MGFGPNIFDIFIFVIFTPLVDLDLSFDTCLDHSIKLYRGKLCEDEFKMAIQSCNLDSVKYL